MPHPFFDVGRFPWRRDEAVALHRELYGAIAIAGRIDLIYRSAGGSTPINVAQPPDLIWRDVLDQCAAQQVMRKLCRRLAEQNEWPTLEPFVRAVESAADLTDVKLLSNERIDEPGSAIPAPSIAAPQVAFKNAGERMEEIPRGDDVTQQEDARATLEQDSSDVLRHFVGRREEQERFKRSFQRLTGKEMAVGGTERLFIFHAEGGFGKSTLLNRLLKLGSEDDPASEVTVVKIDWERDKLPKHASEVEKALRAMDVLCRKLSPFYGHIFDRYRALRRRHAELTDEQERASQEYDWQAGVVDAPHATSDVELNSGSLHSSTYEVTARLVSEERTKFRNWFRRKLHDNDFALYDDPKGQLSRAFVSGLILATQSRPLVLMFDTVEFLLHLNWSFSGLIKHTVPETDRLILVLAGRIPDGVHVAIRNTIRDSLIFESNLKPFSELDVADYLKSKGLFREGPQGVGLARFVWEKSGKGIPLAVDAIVNALANGYDLENVFVTPETAVDTDKIIHLVAYRFLKHCLEDPDRADDRDCIFTMAIVIPGAEDDFPLIDHIWRRLFGPQARTIERINRIQHDYSFIFQDRHMHAVVKEFVCLALSKGKIDKGRLFEINSACLDYYNAKTVLIGDRKRLYRDDRYQLAAMGRINHMLWYGDIAEATSYLCHEYEWAVRYCEFDFANQLLSVVTEKEWLKSRLSNADNSVLEGLQHFGPLLPRAGESTPSVVKLREELFARKAPSERIWTLLDDAARYCRAGQEEHLASAARMLLEAQRLDGRSDFTKERAAAHRLLGLAARRRGDIDLATDHLLVSLSLSSNAHTLVELALTHVKAGRIQDAISCYEEALKQDPTLVFLKKRLELLRQPNTAVGDALENQIRMCELRLKGLPEGSQRYYRNRSYLGRLFMEQGRLADAVAARSVAEAFFQNIGCTYRKSCELYMLLGDFPAALEKAKKGLAVGDDNPGILGSMGDV
jgi:tetratricopeptide (TPR) repeat protein